MNEDRYQEALRRQKERIESGLPLHSVDDTTPGDRHMETTWGLCTTDWPAEDLARPDMPSLGSKPRTDGQKCPFDKGPPSRWGCYHRCRIFQGPVPTRDEAIQLYEGTIRGPDPTA